MFELSVISPCSITPKGAVIIIVIIIITMIIIITFPKVTSLTNMKYN